MNISNSTKKTIFKLLRDTRIKFEEDEARLGPRNTIVRFGFSLLHGNYVVTWGFDDKDLELHQCPPHKYFVGVAREQLLDKALEMVEQKHARFEVGGVLSVITLPDGYKPTKPKPITNSNGGNI